MSVFLLRGFFYFLAAVGLGLLFTNEPHLARDWRPFTEYGYVQIKQAALLLAASLLLFVKARLDNTLRQLAVSLALFILILFIRENDQPIELVLPHGSWKYVALPVVIMLLAYLWKNFGQVREQLLEWSRSFSYGVMLTGFTVLVFARFFGHGELWEHLMGDQFISKVKYAAEEGVELLALGLIFVAAVEFLLYHRSERPEPDAPVNRSD